MIHDLKDITFLFIVRIDTIERVENLLVSTGYLLSCFNTNIDVLEVASYNNGILKTLLDEKINYSFIKDDDPILFRTKYLNFMLNSTETSYVAVWDVDVIAAKEQIIESMEFLRNDEAEFVLPYSGKCFDTSLIMRKLYLETPQLEFLEKHKQLMKAMYPPQAVGGAFLCRLDAYRDIGFENEEFYGWGVEDGDRFIRWENSKYRTKRVTGNLFHLSHPRGLNSLPHNQDQSFLKVRLLEDVGRKTRLVKFKNK